jgi:hypothetical protein
LFQLTKDLIIVWASWIRDLLSLQFNVSGASSLWLVLFFLCFAITLVIRRVVVLPLGLFHGEDGAYNWEKISQTILILGLYIFLLNQIFIQPMPVWIPQQILKALGGFDNTFPTLAGRTSFVEKRVYDIFPWIWYLGPIVVMYIVYLKIRIESYNDKK